MTIRATVSVAALSAGLLASGQAAAVEIGDTGVELYGRLDITMQSNDEAGVRNSELQSNASRIGIKGEHELSEGLEMFFQLEWEVDIVDEKNTSNNHIKARNQVIGLRGSFGEVLAGRHDTPTKKAQAKIDLFSDTDADIKRIFNGEVRADNILQYTTPTLGDAFKAKIALIPGEDPVLGNTGIADGTSISLEYENDDLFVALAQDSDAEGLDIDTTRLVGQYKMGAMQFGLMWQSTESALADEDGLLASFAYRFGDNTFELQHGDADIWMTGTGGGMENQTSIGLERKLGKNAKLYGFYSTGDIGGTTLSNDYVAVGLQYKF